MRPPDTGRTLPGPLRERDTRAKGTVLVSYIRNRMWLSDRTLFQAPRPKIRRRVWHYGVNGTTAHGHILGLDIDVKLDRRAQEDPPVLVCRREPSGTNVNLQ